MALNLVRNSKVFFTTNLDTAANGYKVKSTGFTADNTFELQVLDGFTFSQQTNNEVVTVAEGGAAPVRGQRSFNTSLAPVDFSFSNYIRPFNTGSAITAEESVLWNALLGDQAITAGSTISGVTSVAYAFASGTGIVTIAGTAMTTLPTVGDTIVLSGIATTTPANLQHLLNAAGVVKTATASSITIELTNPTSTAISGTTLTTANTLKFYKGAWAPVASTYSYVSSAGSNKHQLQKFGMVFVVDQVAYAIDNAALGQVSVDFGLDAIATAAWTGQGTQLRQLAEAVTITGGNTFGGGTLTGVFAPKQTAASFITNKLSTVSLTLVNQLLDAAGSTVAAAGNSYTVAITGGNITINNNITYITPAILGIVNAPVTYYTGARAISGSLSAYLRTGGSSDTGQLLEDMLKASAVTIEPMFALSISIGGAPNTIKVVMDMPSTVLTIPAVDVQQVVSTTINFTAQGSVPGTTGIYDLTETNDIAIRYYS